MTKFDVAVAIVLTWMALWLVCTQPTAILTDRPWLAGLITAAVTALVVLCAW